MDHLDHWAFWPAWIVATLIGLSYEQVALRRLRKLRARG